MAYHSSYGTASNTLDLLAKLKTFLVDTCGWTLHDDGMSQTLPYFVVYSAGESGKEDIYLQFIDDSSTGIISVRGALYWDATSHTAVKPVYTTSSGITTADAASFNYWLFADLDRVFVMTRIGALYYGHYSGILKRFWSDKIAVTQAAAGVGSSVTVAVNDASVLTSGKYYVIKDNANIARVQVTATDTTSTPNTITIATLSTGYSAGAKIGEDPQPVIIGSSSLPSCQLLNRYDGYTGQNSHQAYVRDFSNYQTNNSDPDTRYSMVAMFPLFVTSEASNYTELRGELSEVYSIGVGAGASEDVIDLGTETYKIFNITGGSSWIAVKE
ncbi:MAG: hypothetical protein ABFD49_06965 [Armatimonadota bacterium]|nr:hypothetical protein [bacterium]